MKRLALIPLSIGAAGVAAFVVLALEPEGVGEAAFASVFCFLMLGAAAGPFLCRGEPRQAALRCGVLGALAATVTAAFSTDGLVAALLAGGFCGLYAFALGAVGSLGGNPGRLAAATLGLVLPATLHVWDDVALLDATDRKGSARLAFALNPAAAASATWPCRQDIACWTERKRRMRPWPYAITAALAGWFGLRGAATGKGCERSKAAFDEFRDWHRLFQQAKVAIGFSRPV